MNKVCTNAGLDRRRLLMGPPARSAPWVRCRWRGPSVAGGAAAGRADDEVIDTFQFATNPYLVPATVSFEVEWNATGPVETLTDGTTFTARLAPATGSFSGGELGFAFEASGSSSHHAYAEIGTERNGFFR